MSQDRIEQCQKICFELHAIVLCVARIVLTMAMRADEAVGLLQSMFGMYSSIYFPIDTSY